MFSESNSVFLSFHLCHHFPIFLRLRIQCCLDLRLHHFQIFLRLHLNIHFSHSCVYILNFFFLSLLIFFFIFFIYLVFGICVRYWYCLLFLFILLLTLSLLIFISLFHSYLTFTSVFLLTFHIQAIPKYFYGILYFVSLV